MGESRRYSKQITQQEFSHRNSRNVILEYLADLIIDHDNFQFTVETKPEFCMIFFILYYFIWQQGWVKIMD